MEELKKELFELRRLLILAKAVQNESEIEKLNNKIKEVKRQMSKKLYFQNEEERKNGKRN